MNFVKKEIGDRVSPEIVSRYLNLPMIEIGEIKTVYAEIVRLDSKQSVNGNPYISIKFKDINGRVVAGSMFDKTFSAEAMERIHSLQKIYAEVKYEAICFRGNVHLQIKDVVVLDDSQITSEMISSFTPVFKDTDKYLNEIENIGFGEYNSIYELLTRVGLLDKIRNLSFDEFHDAKIGAMSKVFADSLKHLNTLALPEVNLTKISLLYGLFCYATSKPKCALGMNNAILKSLQKLAGMLDVISTQIPGELTTKFCEEVERVVCTLYRVPCTKSVSSVTIEKVLKNYEELNELTVLSKVSAKGYLISYGKENIYNR